LRFTSTLSGRERDLVVPTVPPPAVGTIRPISVMALIRQQRLTTLQLLLDAIDQHETSRLPFHVEV
jgi:hypothetical protein